MKLLFRKKDEIALKTKRILQFTRTVYTFKLLLMILDRKR